MAREILVDCDDKKRRLVYAIVSDRIKQHSASAQVFAESDGRTRFVWTADVLPNEIAPYMDAQMDLGVLAMQKALGRKAGVIFRTDRPPPAPSLAACVRMAPRPRRPAHEEQNHDWS